MTVNPIQQLAQQTGMIDSARELLQRGWSPILAQTGTTKTIIGWVLVLLCLALALLVVGRPNAREPRRRRW